MSKENNYYIVGLGNPGSSYLRTRHNVGFMLLDLIRQDFDFPKFVPNFNGMISTSIIEEKKVTLFKPYTFMNNSGLPVMKLTSFYKVKPEDIIVGHDDADLSFGRIKIKKGGGNAGHNGLKSIDANIENNYWRLRIGIGRSDQQDLADYVLANFTQEERIEEVLKDISSNLKRLLTEDKDSFNT